MEEKKGKQAKAAAVVSDAQLENISRSTRDKLRAQGKVPVIIQQDGGDANAECIINGVTYRFPKGKVVMLPIDVYRLLRDRYSVIEQSEAFSNENEFKEVRAF